MKKKLLKIILYFLIAFTLLISLKKGYEELTGDFRIANISFENTSFQPKDHSPLSKEVDLEKLKKILNQEFHYLGKGNQTYAFLSQDSKYVLKFFKFGHLKKWTLDHFLPQNFLFPKKFAKKEKMKEFKFFRVFEGYRVAYEKDPQGSALIYVHLNKTKTLQEVVKVKDKLGLTHFIDLDQVVFVLQEKVVPTGEVFKELLKKDDLEGVKKKIGQLFELYLSQYQKGLFDEDHNLIHNTGFKGDLAIRLDVGKLKEEEKIKGVLNYKKDLEKIAFIRLNRFFKTYYPKQQQEIADSMKFQLDAIFKDLNN